MSTMERRQNLNGDTTFIDDDEGSWWWTRDGQIVRWSLFWGLLSLFLLFIFVGHWHAKKRIDKGFRPLGYHRWMLSRRQRARYDPAYQDPHVVYNPYHPHPQGQQYGMYPMPPPMYDPNAPLPPTYQPPEGASKVDPSQWRTEPTRRPAETGEPSPAYDAPPGPPPAAVHANHTGGSSSSNNPYRL